MIVIFGFELISASCGEADVVLEANGLAATTLGDAREFEAVEPCSFSRRRLRIYIC